jgi:sensor histidine kinase YesM
MRKVFVRSLWTLLAIVILGSAVAFTAIWNGFIGYMPPVEDLQNPINRFATSKLSIKTSGNIARNSFIDSMMQSYSICLI